MSFIDYRDSGNSPSNMDVDGQNIFGVHRSRKQQLRRGSVYPARRWYPHVHRRLFRLLWCFEALSV